MSENQATLDAEADARPGHLYADFGELHYEANTFDKKTEITLTKRPDGFYVKVNPSPRLHKMVKLYLKPNGSLKKVRGANSRPLSPDVEMVNGEEWYVIRMHFEEIIEIAGLDTPVKTKTLSGFVILSN